MSKRLIDITELAEILSVKVNTLRSWVQKKQIPYKKLQRFVRFDPEEIREFIDTKTVRPLQYVSEEK